MSSADVAESTATVEAKNDQVLHANDGVAIVESLMSSQKANGFVFLKSTALKDNAVKSLHSPGERFSVACTIKPVTKALSEGPSMYLEICVPSSRNLQVKACQNDGLLELPTPLAIDPARFSQCLPASEAAKHLMALPSPMFPAVN